MIAAWLQAAGEYAAAAGQSGGAGRTGVPGLDRALGGIEKGWDTFMVFALEHPVAAVVGGLVLGLLVERLLTRRQWRF